MDKVANFVFAMINCRPTCLPFRQMIKDMNTALDYFVSFQVLIVTVVNLISDVGIFVDGIITFWLLSLMVFKVSLIRFKYAPKCVF